MTDKTEAQPEALRLAEQLAYEATNTDMGRKPIACTRRKAAAELRRQHAEIQQLKAEKAEIAAINFENYELQRKKADAATATVYRFHYSMKDAGWHPGRTDDDLTDIIRAKGRELAEVVNERDFYKHRCDALQAAQSTMRDPERTVVCDILANGHLLQDGTGKLDATRYAQLSARQSAPDAIGHVRIDSGEVHIYPRNRDAESSGLVDGQLVYAAAPPPPEREPLSRQKIHALDSIHWTSAIEFARAIERAHGIGATND